jgi:hypothetical protein
MAVASNQAHATPYTLYFADPPHFAGDGYHALPGLTGSFDYDATTSMFSDFAVIWTHSATIQNPYTNTPDPLFITQTDTFDFTGLANGPITFGGGIIQSSLGLVNTPADNFRLLSHGFPSQVPIMNNSNVMELATLRAYEVGVTRSPGLGSPLGEGELHFDIQYCGSTCESFFSATVQTPRSNSLPQRHPLSARLTPI